MQEGKIINSFQSLLENLDKLTYSSYLCELIDICVEDREANSVIFREFITSLYLLSTDAIDYELIARTFELRLLSATGYGIEFDHCVSCKKKIATAEYISFSNYGGICSNCKREHGIYISKGTYNALRFLNNTPMDKIYRLSVSKDIRKEIERVTTYIISSNYSRKPKSLDMLNYIKE